MTRREELEAEVTRLMAQATADEERAKRMRRRAAHLHDEAAALPPDPPVFRVSEAVSRKALDARARATRMTEYGIQDSDRVEHAALIQAFFEEQFSRYPADMIFTAGEIRARAGLT